MNLNCTMKKKYMWALFLLVVIIYFYVCVNLYRRLSFDLVKQNGAKDLEQKRDYLWDFVKPIPQCQCSAFVHEALIPHGNNGNLTRKRHHGNRSCSFSLPTFSTNVEMPDVIREMSLDYPSYVWTHNGFVQQMDTTYSTSQWDNEPLEVFVVPFSHHDPGWINSYETYYSSWTKATLDLVVEQLTHDPNLTFVWAEVLLLERWYRETDEKSQAAFKKLLESERFEIVSGAWVTSDEAITHYGAFLDQLMEGQLWLSNELGYHVRSAWGLDPFGHSSTVAHLLRRSGIDAMYIQRAHYAVKKHLAYKKQLEFTWQQDWDDSPESSIFCHLAPYLLYGIQYSCGPDINICCQFDFTHKKCWQWGQYQAPKPITPNNIQTRAYELLDQLRKKAQFFHHNFLLFPFGDDFRFTNKIEWNKQFKNLTQVFRYMNGNPEMKVKVKFSTLSKYLEAVKTRASKASGWTLPSLKGDFFTYSDRSDQYWSGYFSSRPILKSLARILQSRLRANELLFSLALTFGQPTVNSAGSVRDVLSMHWRQLEQLRRDLAFLQHHHTITGTSRLSVARESLRFIRGSLESSRNLISELINLLLQFPKEHVVLTVLEEQSSAESLPKLQLLDLDATGESIVLVFNPLARDMTQIVRLLVPSTDVQIFDMAGNSILCQVSPVLDRAAIFVEGQFEVYFEVSVAALGLAAFKIKKQVSADKTGCHRSYLTMINFHLSHKFSSLFHINWHETSHLSISSRHLSVTLCKCTYLMQSIVTKSHFIPYKAEMKFAFYRTGRWMNSYWDKSESYGFLPNGPAKDMACRNCKAVMIEGPLVSTATTWMNITSQSIALYNTDGIQGFGVHVANHVDLRSHDDVEIVLKLKTSVANFGYFYTDQNGFQMHRRQTLSRLPIQGNFYPMTSAAFIQDGHVRFSLLSAESHAVASLDEGTLEIILDRRVAPQDDGRGLKEGIQDNIPVYSRFVLVVEPWKRRFSLSDVPPLAAYPSRLVQQLSLSLENPPLILSSSGNKFNSLASDIQFHLFHIDRLPCNIHLLNLKSLKPNPDIHRSTELLLVLHNVGVECSIEDAPAIEECSASDEVLLSSMFRHSKIVSVDEMTLTGTEVVRHLTPGTPVAVRPMEIRTWKLLLQ